MKRFLCRIFVFLTILGGLLVGACFFMPYDTAKNTMLGAQVDKMKCLSELPGERIIIVGWSGCGQGFVISDLCAALDCPVYNMGLHAGLGLIYQMKSVEPLVRKGDTVILIPEYANFDGSSCFGDAELLMMVCDIIPEHKALLEPEHWMQLLALMPKYGADKLRHLFMLKRVKRSQFFDSFGDAIYPTNRRPLDQIVFPDAEIKTMHDFAPNVVHAICEFACSTRARGANVYLFPPAFKKMSFTRQKGYIERIQEELGRSGLPFAASAERYALDDKYFYDTYYHLNLEGRRYRTGLMIEDIQRLKLTAQ